MAATLETYTRDIIVKKLRENRLLLTKHGRLSTTAAQFVPEIELPDGTALYSFGDCCPSDNFGRATNPSTLGRGITGKVRNELNDTELAKQAVRTCVQQLVGCIDYACEQDWGRFQAITHVQVDINAAPNLEGARVLEISEEASRIIHAIFGDSMAHTRREQACVTLPGDMMTMLSARVRMRT